MLYQHLRSRGFQEAAVGVVIYQANIIVPIAVNEAIYKLEENSPIERSYLVGLTVTKPGVIVDQTKTQATGDIFSSARLDILVNTTQAITSLYLEQILYANQQGRPYYLYLPGRINLSETKLVVSKNDTISANTVIEFQAQYAKLKARA